MSRSSSASPAGEAETPGDAEAGPACRNQEPAVGVHEPGRTAGLVVTITGSQQDAMSDRSLVLLFVKSPEKGKVKSRLAAALGEETALELYRCFVIDTVDLLRRGRYPFRICYDPPDSEATITGWLGAAFRYRPQRGEDLGSRMKNAFIDAFSEGYKKALLIGSDIPDLENRVIVEALVSLDRHEAAIGPAADGGYYLIGFTRQSFLPGIFDGITWGTDSVFRDTMGILHESGSSVHVLPAWRDIDSLDDLRALVFRNADTGFKKSATMKYLTTHTIAAR